MYRGIFKYKNTSGVPITYNTNDVILYQGRQYVCLESTQQSPLQNPDSWEYTGMSETYFSDNPPVNPKENQIWLGSSGRSYIWLKDANGFQWVEI